MLTAAERGELVRLCKQVAEQEKGIVECSTTEIARMSRLLKVSTSGVYHREKHSAPTELMPQLQGHAGLEVKILAHFRVSEGTYGSLRITADLWEEGDRVSVDTDS